MTLGSLIRLDGFVILFYYVKTTPSSNSVSMKTLELYILVFIGRLSSILFYEGYLPFDSSGDWLYQSVEICSLIFCGLSVFYILTKAIPYSFLDDSFANVKQIPPQFGPVVLVVPVLIASMIFRPTLNNNFITDTLWTFGAYLETIAILPQFYILQKQNRAVEPLISHFVFAIGLSRLFLFVFWAASFHELHDRKIETILDGFEGWFILLVQVSHLAIMAEFCFYYIMAARDETPLIIPNIDV